MGNHDQASIAGEHRARQYHEFGLLVAFAMALCGALLVQPAHATASAADEKGTDLEATIHAGWKAIKEHRFVDAQWYFEYAVARVPQRMDVQIGLGEAMLGSGDAQGALGHFERGAELAPTVARAHIGIGRACLRLAIRDYQKPRTRMALLARAQAEFESVLKRNPDHEGARDGLHQVKLTRWPIGRPIWVLELAVAALLVALVIAYVFRLRKGTLPHLREYRWPLALFAGSRLLIFTAFAVAPLLLAKSSMHPLPIIHEPERFVLDTVVGRWDSNLYVEVAYFGYRLPFDHLTWGTIGQFPLLPLMLRGLAFALNDTLWAAAIIPNFALLFAILLLFGLFKEQYGQRVAIGAICVMLLHPASLHGSVLYAESLALLGIVGTVLSVQSGAFVTAGLWGIFAGLARVNTLAIVPWLLYDWWRSPGGRSLPSLLARLSPIFGVALFMLYLQLEFDDITAYFYEVSSTRFGDRPLFVTVSDTIELFAHIIGLQAGPVSCGPLPVLVYAFACLAVYAISLVALVRERAFGPALMVASGIILALGSNLASQPRYLWILFPVAVTIARFADRPVLRYALPLLSLGGLFLASVAYARWYFVP